MLWAMLPKSIPHAGDGSGEQMVDPVLEHLLKKARSQAVRREFLRGTPLQDLIDDHQLRLLVRQAVETHAVRAKRRKGTAGNPTCC